MSTLLFRLAGPMQSWGTQSRFSMRDTGLEPSKSGVIGLLCAALGRPREAPLSDLVALRMGVRVDREGLVHVDYQTAGGTHRRGESYGVAKASGGTPDTVQSNRYYLADASFLVGLEGDEALLRRLDGALAAPMWQLSLGRKAYPPGEPIRLPDEPPLGPGLREEPLERALEAYAWPGPRHPLEAAPTEVLRLVIEGRGEDEEVRRDVPLSFETRGFAIRYVLTRRLARPQEGGNDVPVPTDPERS